MTDINLVGEFSSIDALWSRYPEGGIEGDYAIVGGVKYQWDKYNRQWISANAEPETPARKITDVWGDMHVHNDLRIGGKLYAASVKQPNVGLFATFESLQAEYPNPKVGMWAVIGDSIPGYIYRCDTEGEWSATGEKGGVDELENVVLYSAQTLTNAQRLQVLENLGMDVITTSEMEEALSD